MLLACSPRLMGDLQWHSWHTSMPASVPLLGPGPQAPGSRGVPALSWQLSWPEPRAMSLPAMSLLASVERGHQREITRSQPAALIASRGTPRPKGDLPADLGPSGKIRGQRGVVDGTSLSLQEGQPPVHPFSSPRPPAPETFTFPENSSASPAAACPAGVPGSPSGPAGTRQPLPDSLRGSPGRDESQTLAGGLTRAGPDPSPSSEFAFARRIPLDGGKGRAGFTQRSLSLKTPPRTQNASNSLPLSPSLSCQ